VSVATTVLLLVTGAATGTVGAILGLGGGVFLVPALVLAFGVPIQAAAGAGLVAVVATSCAAASVNVKKGIVNVELGLVLETATVLGAVTGGFAAAHLPANILVGVFAALLALITALLFRDKAGQDDAAVHATGAFPARYKDMGREVKYGVDRIGAGMGTAFAAGNLSGLLGVGGGVIKVPVLHLFCGMPMKAAAATSNFMIGVTGATGAVVYFANGKLDLTLSGLVTLGVLAGSTLGAWASKHLSGRAVRKAFAVLTFFLSILMLRRSLGL
jgi:uncharacterized membrane protein YfcA